MFLFVTGNAPLSSICTKVPSRINIISYVVPQEHRENADTFPFANALRNIVFGAFLLIARYLDYYDDIQGQQPDFLDLRFVVRQPTAFF